MAQLLEARAHRAVIDGRADAYHSAGDQFRIQAVLRFDAAAGQTLQHASQLRLVAGRQFASRSDIGPGHTQALVQLPVGDQAQLRGVLERLTGRRVEAQYRWDPKLIAGTVVRIGSTIYDGSVRTRIEKLAHQLASE